MAEPVSEKAFQEHVQAHKHKLENPLRDVILGGQDGLVNALGIILGVAAASSDIHVLIATVLAATFAESLSMGAVAYTSALSQKDYYHSERKKEEQEVEEEPEMEREEIRRIYAGKGIKGQALEEVVESITSNKTVWVDVMMAEELHLEPVNTRNVLKSSVIVTIATAIGHLIPVVPFFFFALRESLILALVVSAITLFIVGAYQAITLVGSWWKSGIRMLVIGMVAALVGFAIAKLFHVSTG